MRIVFSAAALSLRYACVMRAARRKSKSTPWSACVTLDKKSLR
jgi:hypothetical protein